MSEQVIAKPSPHAQGVTILQLNTIQTRTATIPTDAKVPRTPFFLAKQDQIDVGRKKKEEPRRTNQIQQPKELLTPAPKGQSSRKHVSRSSNKPHPSRRDLLKATTGANGSKNNTKASHDASQ